MNRFALTWGVALLLFTQTSRGVTYDAAHDFSHAENPNGVWSYGWEDSFGFHLFTEKVEVGPDVFFWTGGDGPLGEPTTGKNDGEMPFIVNRTTVYEPGELGLHPGRQGQRAVLRWTAPESGKYSIDVGLRVGDPQTTTDFRVAFGDEVVSSGFLNGPDARGSFSESFWIEKDEYVDLLIGFGVNETFWFDTTLTEMKVTGVPDAPHTTWLLLVALASLLVLKRRF